MAKLLEVSAKEHELLEAWAKYGSLTAAARALGIPQSTMSNRKARLAWRYRRAKQFIREVERLEAKLPGALE
jgi:molybdenum-dependent DNA-binding transcriptional regulator ModE